MQKGVLKPVFLSSPTIPVLVMSASFRLDKQSKFGSIMAVRPTHVHWGPMDWRSIAFCMTVAGNVCNSISKEIVYYLKYNNATCKVILYSNTKLSAEGHLLALTKKTVPSNLVDGDDIPLTGNSSLMMKNWLVALFSGSIHSSGSNL
jgi:hypothetical protein